jgi:peptide/nickel transport system permease protein
MDTLKYVIKRIIIAIIVFLGITVAVYFISSLAPGSPIDALMTPGMSAADIELFRVKMGLDQPVYVQYFNWLVSFFHGDFGYSMKSGEPILNILVQRVRPTLILMIASTVFAILIAVPLGVLSAYKPYSVIDYVSSGLAFLGAAMPTFFISLAGIYIFSVVLGWLPISGMYAAGDKSFSSLVHHMAMPVGVMAFSLLGNLVRQTRSSMMEIINDDYVRTARSKGLSEIQVVLIHALRNALIPIVTQIGNLIPFVVGGSVVVEQIFGWPGIGSWMVEAILGRDYSVIMSLTVIIASTVLVCNIVIDMIYTLLDPRIHHEA